MDTTAKKLKQIVKGVAPKSTFGTDPKDPWSARAGITEGALEQYLMSRGINPKFVSTQTKISHAKSSAFLKWKNDHMVESTDKKDTVVLDIPLLIRVLELAREDIKTDMDLHRVVEKLISIRTKGVLTMDDYNTIANIKENHIAIAMGKMLDDEGSMILDQMDQLERAITMIRTYVGKDYEKQIPAWVQSKVTLATDYVDTVGNYLSSKNEEVVSEMDKSQTPPGRDGGTQFPPGPKVSKKTIKAVQKDPVKHLSDLFTKEYAKKKMKEDVEIEEGLQQTLRKYVPGYAKAQLNKKMNAQNYASGDSIKKTVDKDVNYNRYKKVADKLNKEEVVSEVSSELLDRYKEKAKKSADDLSSKGQYKKSTDRWMNVMKATGKQIEKTTANIRKSLHGEEVEEIDEGLKQKLAGLAVAGAMAASAAGHAHAQDSRRITPGETDTRWSHVQQTPAPEKKPEAKKDGPGFSKEYLQQVKDGSHPRPMVSKEKAEELLKKHYNEELSKSARIIKALYRHHRMAEDMYDHEKEDKSVASYGKPPKMATNDPKKNIGDKAQAAAVLSGGKTLTGQTRDTLEIDPIMRKAGPLDQNKKI